MTFFQHSITNRISWKLKYSFLPRRCNLSNELIWLKYAYKGTELITGPGEPVVNYYWHSVHEHIIWILKNDR